MPYLSTLTRPTESNLTTPDVQRNLFFDTVCNGSVAEIKPVRKRKKSANFPKESRLRKIVGEENSVFIESTIVAPITATWDPSTATILPKAIIDSNAQLNTASAIMNSKKIKASEDYEKALRERRRALRATAQKYTKQLCDNVCNTDSAKPTSKSKLGATAANARKK